MSWMEKTIVGAVVALVLAAVVFGVVLLFGGEERPEQERPIGDTPGQGSGSGRIVKQVDISKVPRSQSIRGSVRNENGDGMPRARVALVMEQPDVPGAQIPDEMVRTTGEDGSFIFDELTPGQYTVTAEADDYAMQAEGGVRVGEDVDLVMSAGGLITGTVRVPGGGPAEKAKVTIRRLARNLQSSNTLKGTERITRADNRGVYRFDNVASGPWQIFAKAKGYLQEGDVKVKVRPGAQATVDIGLTRPSSILGRVLNAKTGEPIPDADVWIGGGGKANVPPNYTTKTDEEGIWRLAVAPTLRNSIRVFADGYAPSGQLDINWAAGSAEHAVETVHLQPGGTASGVVVSHDGKPVKGARIDATEDLEFDYYHSARYGEAFGMRRIKSSKVLTDKDGKFTYKNLKAGNKPVQITAWVPRYLVGHSRKFTVTPSSPTTGLRIVLPRGATLYGKVTDEQNKPVARARVSVSISTGTEPLELLMSASAPFSGTGWVSHTGSDGKYEARPLKAGDATVRVDAIGHEPAVLKLKIEKDRRIERNFKLKSGHAIAGVVHDPDGKPFPRVEVTADNTGSAPVERQATVKTRSDAEGRFELRGLPEGKYRLITRYPGSFSEIANGIEAGRRDVVLTVGRPATIRGSVYCDDPDMSIMIHAKGRESGRHASAHIKSGPFLLEELRPDTYDISINANDPDYEGQKMEGIVVGPGKTFSGINVTLVRGSKPPPTPVVQAPPVQLVETKILPNSETAVSRFDDQEAKIFVAIGSGILNVGGQKINVKEGYYHIIPKGMPFSFKNNTNETVIMYVEVQGRK